jgi:glycosyltransferase involved in cell wall biosynthesis
LTSPLHIVLLDYRDIHHPLAGGAEIFINEIFQRVAAHGHRVTLLCGGYPGAASEDRIGNFRVLRAGNTATANFVGAYAALRLARRERVDLFVENLCKLPFLLPALTKKPVLPIVLHLFGHTVFQEANALLGSYVWLYEKLIPPVYRGLHFVALSESTAADLERRGVRASRMDVVHIGVDLKHYQTEDEVPRSDRPLLVYVGRLKRYKGLDRVIQAFSDVRRSLPDARLAFVGKGDDRPRLEQLVRSLGLEGSISFEGFVSEEEKVRWLRRAHALVYPSPREGWGISTTEAAACGTPVLASDSDGLREAVRDGSNGFLVPHQDREAWARRMLQLLTDAPLRKKLGATGLAWAREFDWDREAEKMRAAVETVAAGGARSDA